MAFSLGTGASEGKEPANEVIGVLSNVSKVNLWESRFFEATLFDA